MLGTMLRERHEGVEAGVKCRVGSDDMVEFSASMDEYQNESAWEGMVWLFLLVERNAGGDGQCMRWIEAQTAMMKQMAAIAWINNE